MNIQAFNKIINNWCMIIRNWIRGKLKINKQKMQEL